jgi:hypothetical protein
MNDSRDPQDSRETPRIGARRDTRRRFEQWVRNTGCEANLVSAVHNVKMSVVARRENPSAPREGQSVFALARGRAFEAGLVRDGGQRLIDALLGEGIFDDNVPNSKPVDFRDFRISANGGPLADLDDAIDRTEKFLRDLAESGSTAHGESGSDRGFVGVVSSAAVRIPKGVMLPEATLIIDALTVTHELVGSEVQEADRNRVTRPVIRVGEIKTYSDRGGHTSRGDLAVARAQMGLYVHALQLVVEQLGLADHIHISDRGFLVLTYPGSNAPSVRADEDLRYQAERARRGFDLLEKSALALPDVYGDEDVLDDTSHANPVDLVLGAPTEFGDQCLSFCERADACYERALSAGDGAVLGDGVARFLNGLSLHRADELMGGDKPKTEAEIDFLRRMQTPLESMEVSR